MQQTKPRKTITVFLVSTLLALTSILVGPQAAAQAAPADDVITYANQNRAVASLSPLSYHSELTQVAQAWAVHMGEVQNMYHNPNLSTQVSRGWTRIGENVAYGYPNAVSVSAAWMNSEGHRANILGDYTHMGVGVYTDGNGTIWWVQVFAKYPPASPPPVVTPPPPAPPVVTPPPTTPSPTPTNTTPPSSNNGGNNTSQPTNPPSQQPNNTGQPNINNGGQNTTSITPSNKTENRYTIQTITEEKEEIVDPELVEFELTTQDSTEEKIVATGVQPVTSQQIEKEPFGPGGIVIIFLAVTILGVAFTVHRANTQELRMRQAEH